jgi:hypothetical protein
VLELCAVFLSATTDGINVFVDYLPFLIGCELPKFDELVIVVLLLAADARKWRPS